jgi:hypothetical protein
MFCHMCTKLAHIDQVVHVYQHVSSRELSDGDEIRYGYFTIVIYPKIIIFNVT